VRRVNAAARRAGVAFRLVLVVAVLLAGAGAAHAGHDGPGPPVLGMFSDYLKRLMDAREPVLPVDLRKPAEYRAGHVPGAISIPLADLGGRVREIPRTGRVVLYCQCAREDLVSAFVFLRSQGYTNHVVLEDGFDGWLRRRYPVAQ
jgi:rhodanese-related sulfurtransferase